MCCCFAFTPLFLSSWIKGMPASLHIFPFKEWYQENHVATLLSLLSKSALKIMDVCLLVKYTRRSLSFFVLDVALEREAEGDMLLADMGAGVPFRPGMFDGAISISAVQWLCYADSATHRPAKRLYKLFMTLFESLVLCLCLVYVYHCFDFVFDYFSFRFSIYFSQDASTGEHCYMVEITFLENLSYYKLLYKEYIVTVTLAL